VTELRADLPPSVLEWNEWHIRTKYASAVYSCSFLLIEGERQLKNDQAQLAPPSPRGWLTPNDDMPFQEPDTITEKDQRLSPE
jgi:hypothetical protein